MKKMVIGNQAIAYGALAAGIDVASGYPGTPSSEVLAEILAFSAKNEKAPYVEWSTNEKVGVEVAAAAAWAGKRALATMKMSGINVASDSVLSLAYSGTRGGFVIYIADDPGAEAGMPEQDTRVFAMWAGLPVLETTSPGQAYEMCQYAFELSEAIELPVILRSVTSVSHAQELLEADFAYHKLDREADFDRDIFRFTKAGAKICLDQHQALLDRLSTAEKLVHEKGINRIGESDGTLYAIGVGNVIPYIQETIKDTSGIVPVYMESSYPLDRVLLGEVFKKAEKIVIFEELEPVAEMLIRSEANKLGFKGKIFGKIDDNLPRVGKYSINEIKNGYALLKGESPQAPDKAGSISVKHPITFCTGCPHRGSYMAINRALKKTKLGKKETIVTGDIGCTILGMNPPFDSCWTEVSMGSSIGLAQGFALAGMKNPVVATIGDSTFFHAGIPPLVNAVQHRTDILLIILDNGWTSMTGFQVNPGTEVSFQQNEARRVSIDKIVQAIGVDAFDVIHPFEQDKSVEVISDFLMKEGVRVLISREECALTKGRREPFEKTYDIDPEKCTFCKACLRETGCPALAVRPGKEKQIMWIDPELCVGCGLCETCCKFDAIHEKRS